jgi:preprotein translocase subunit SecG
VDIVLLVLHVILSLGIITLVLLQKGAGASAGAAFGGGGGGGAGSVFGATGSANFLSKTTALLATGFFVNSMVLAYLAANRDIQTDSVLDALTAPQSEISVPAVEEKVEDADVPQADVPAAAPVSEIPAAVEADAASSEDVPAADIPSPAPPPAE